MAAPTLVSTTFRSIVNSTSWSADGPATVAQGDLLVAFILTDDTQLANTGSTTGTPGWPTGWTPILDGINHSAGGDCSGAMAYKEAGAGDVASGTPVNYTITWPNASQGSITFFRVTGHDSTTPIDDATSEVTASGQTQITLPAVTTTGDDRLLLACFGVDESNVNYDPYWAEPPITGWTSLVGTSGTFSGQGESSTYAGACFSTQANAGSSGTKVVTTDAQNDAITGFLVAISPAAGGPITADVSQTSSVSTTISADVAGVPDVQMGHWRWFANVSSPTVGDALAAEDVVPTLTQTHVENGIIRLRVQLVEKAGTSDTQALQVQYSEDDTNWNTIASQTPAGDTEVFWVRWRDGASTAGGTISSQLLTGTTESGTYIEDANASVAVSASATREIDLALQIHWPPPDTTIRLRILWNGTPLVLDTGRTQIQVTTPGPSQRSHSIGRLTAISGIIRNQENRFAPDIRHAWVDTYSRWFFITGDGSETPSGQLRYYTWDGSGNWSSPTSFSIGSGALTGGLHKPCFRKVSDGEWVVLVVTRQSSSTRYWRRGRVTSASAITWDTGESNSYYSDRHVAVDMDDADHWWIGGIDAVAGGIWGASSVNPDGGASGWTGGFGTRHTVAASGVASGDLIAIRGLGSGKALFVWANAGGGSLQYALCDASTGFGTVRTIASPAHPNDWGLVRANGWVYCIHTNNLSDSSGSWVFEAYEESDDATGFSTATSPSQSHTDAGGNDGLPLSHVGDDIYVHAVWRGFEGGQDRKLIHRKYTGPGRSGSWGALTDTADNGGRVNMDYLLAPAEPGNGALVPITLSGDDALLGTNFVLEYFTIQVSTAHTADVSISSSVAQTVDAVRGAVGDVSVSSSVAQTISATREVFADVSISSSVAQTVDAVRGVEVDLPLTLTADTSTDAVREAFADVSQTSTVDQTISAVLGVDVQMTTSVGMTVDAVAHPGLGTPARGAFYYPWFPETWTVGGEPVKWTPQLGLYDLDAGNAADIYDQHIAWLDQAGIEFIIVSWWAIGDGNVNTKGTDHNEDTRLPLLLSRIANAGTGLKVAFYYEEEGFSDPSVAALQTDLDYIRTTYADDPAYLWRDGAPVVFVYNSGDTDVTNCLSRWDTTTNGFSDWYVVMKVFPNYGSATPAPNSWHQYGPASREDVQGTYSYTISPGYWQANDPDPPGGEFPYLARDPSSFLTAVQNMVAANTTEWHLITTFNEWGEGTAIEPSTNWGILYLDALGTDGALTLADVSQTSTAAITCDADVTSDIVADVAISSAVAQTIDAVREAFADVSSTSTVAQTIDAVREAFADVSSTSTVAQTIAADTGAEVVISSTVAQTISADTGTVADVSSTSTVAQTIDAVREAFADVSQTSTVAQTISADTGTVTDVSQTSTVAQTIDAVREAFADVAISSSAGITCDAVASAANEADVLQSSTVDISPDVTRGVLADVLVSSGVSTSVQSSKDAAADLTAPSTVDLTVDATSGPTAQVSASSAVDVTISAVRGAVGDVSSTSTTDVSPAAVIDAASNAQLQPTASISASATVTKIAVVSVTVAYALTTTALAVSGQIHVPLISAATSEENPGTTIIGLGGTVTVLGV